MLRSLSYLAVLACHLPRTGAARPGRSPAGTLSPICGWESTLAVVTYVNEGSMAADPAHWDARSAALKAARSGGSEW
jgi:hypothetical protein